MKKLPKLNKLYCDKSIDFLKKLPDESIDLCHLDPPWEYQRNINRVAVKYNDDIDDNIFKTLMECYRVMKPNTHLYMWATSPKLIDQVGIIKRTPFEYKQIINWIKKNPNTGKLFMGMGYYWRNTSEYIMLLIKGKKRTNLRNVRNTLEFPNIGHSHKPEQILEKIFLQSSEKGSIILDPYYGKSSNLGVIAEKMGRMWLGCEINQENVDEANQRMEYLRKDIALPVDMIVQRIKQFRYIPKKKEEIFNGK